MIYKAKALKGFHLNGKDGEIGKVKEFYFDDHHWTIRYLVADTGKWLEKNQVLLSPYSLLEVDQSDQYISVDLTKQQIEDSPPLESHETISRKFEDSYYGYYKWPVYWTGTYMWGAYPHLERDPEARDEHIYNDSENWEPHLRSTQEVSGNHIEATDGSIGHVEDFLIDVDTWTIRYLVVNTHNLWPGRQILLSPEWIEHISWSDAKVFVNLPRETIKNAPKYVENSLLTREYEEGLHLHYNRKGYWVNKAIDHEILPKFTAKKNDSGQFKTIH